MARFRAGALRCGLAGALGFACDSALAQPDLAAVGLPDLIARLAPAPAPTGEGVSIAQIEPTVTVGMNAYLPNAASPLFTGVNFVSHTAGGTVSGHATNVGRYMYGVDALSHGVRDVHCWLADHWLMTGALNTGLGSAAPPTPMPPVVRVANHSWIGTFGVPHVDNDALRRLDYMIVRDNVLVSAAVGWQPNWMLANAYNVVAVCTATVNPFGYITPGSLDGQGRMRPDIVSPTPSRSEATAFVSAAAAVLTEAARGMSDANAERWETLKACLMAGAAHRPTWSNGAPQSGPNRGVATRPLDPLYGADTLNIDRAHLALTGGERAGAATSSGASHMPRAAWEYPSLQPGESRYYRFAASDTVNEVIVSAAWGRHVPDTLDSFACADFDLELWRVDAGGSCVPLTGPAGEGLFAAGNVASRSGVDNVEHLRVLGLAPGEYVLEVRRKDAIESPWRLAVAWLWPRQACAGDANADNLVDFLDLNALLGQYGQSGSPGQLAGDLNKDGVVDFLDLNIVLSYFGEAC